MNFAHGPRFDFEATLMQAWRNKPEPLLRHVQRMIDDIVGRFEPSAESAPANGTLSALVGQEG